MAAVTAWLNGGGSLPRVAAAFPALVVVVTLVGAGSLFAPLSLQPGNTLLGDHNIWNVVTFALLEPNIIKLAVSVLLAGRLAIIALTPNIDPTRAAAHRVPATVAVSVATAGLALSMGYLMAYMSSGVESYLYRSIYGTGPLLGALSVCAFHAAGDAPALPSLAPWLPTSALPLAILVSEFIAQHALRVSRGFAGTLLATGMAWTYLRFWHQYAAGSFGDGRPSFEFIAMLPAPAHPVLRPLLAVLSSLLLRLPLFRFTTGDGMTALPSTSADLPAGMGSHGGAAGQRQSPGHALSSGAGATGGPPGTLHGSPDASALGSGGVAVPDAVAERRREKALRQLDRRLAEMRAGRSGAGGIAASSPAAAALAASAPAPAVVAASATMGAAAAEGSAGSTATTNGKSAAAAAPKGAAAASSAADDAGASVHSSSGDVDAAVKASAADARATTA